ncbi:MAG: DUF4139 domain-containing protein [Myxococcaceae bacterium]|nr:DUF4139 domain-containing protein [Myxococcaceae bacterium]
MNATSSLEAVTVYRDGAICTRRCRLEGPGPDTVRVVGLPLSLLPGSVRARVRLGPVGLHVRDVRPAFDVTFGDAIDESAEVKAKDAARLEVQRLETSFQRLDAEARELQALKPARYAPEEGAPPRPAPVEAALALAAFVDERLKALLAEKRTVEKALKQARDEAQLRERRLAEASAEQRTQKAKVTRAVAVTLSHAITSPIELDVEYQVPGVRWVPNYTLRLEPGFGGGALRLRASVAQDTGEDWKGVALSLSTAELLRRTDVPELKSLRVGRSQPAPPKAGFRAPPPGLDALFEGFDGMARRPPPIPEPAPVAPPKPRPPPMAPQGAAKQAVDIDEDEADGAAAPPRSRSTGVQREFAKRAPGAPPPPSAAPMPVSHPAMARRAAAPRGGGIAASLGGVLETLAADDAPAFDDEGGDYGHEEPTGAGLRGPGAPPAFVVQDDLLDYGNLIMPGADQPARRGRLAPAGPWASVFAVGVTVQVDVIMVLVEQFNRRAAFVSQLAPPPGCIPVASVDRFDFRYDCAARVDVPSTGTWSTVPVMDCRVGLGPQYVCVPAVEPKVYHTLAIRNDTPMGLLAGPVDVSVGDEFLMTTAMPAVPPGAHAERLGLGVEEALKVSRKTTFAETTGGFLGGSTVLRHDVEIELNNRLSSPALVEVRERLPQPAAEEKDVKVEEVKIEPSWEGVEGPLDGVVTHGLKRWKVTVPAGQRLRLSAQYAIRIPADKMIVGGNRRD